MGLVVKNLCVIDVVPSFRFYSGMPFPPGEPWFLLKTLCLFSSQLSSRTLRADSVWSTTEFILSTCPLLRMCWPTVFLADGSSERGEKDASKITTYPPGAVRFDCELRAVQVSCGFHHSGRLISLMAARVQVCPLRILRSKKKPETTLSGVADHKIKNVGK